MEQRDLRMNFPKTSGVGLEREQLPQHQNQHLHLELLHQLLPQLLLGIPSDQTEQSARQGEENCQKMQFQTTKKMSCFHQSPEIAEVI